MNSPEKDISSYLGTVSSLGLEEGSNLGYAMEPETPNSFATIFNSGGEDSEVNYNYERPTIQVRVRGEVGGEYDTSYDLIKGISDELHGLVNETINSTRYVGVWKQGDILPLERDRNDRWIFVCNFKIHRTG